MGEAKAACVGPRNVLLLQYGHNIRRPFPPSSNSCCCSFFFRLGFQVLWLVHQAYTLKQYSGNVNSNVFSCSEVMFLSYEMLLRVIKKANALLPEVA